MVQLTYIALGILFTGILHDDEFLVSVSKPLLWGIVTSFSSAPLFDKTVYHRMRIKNGWSVLTFWVGNLALHFLPLVFVSHICPHWFHCWVAACFHILWFFVTTKGTFVLDEEYVPLSKRTWIVLTCIALLTELSTWSPGPSLGHTSFAMRNPLVVLNS